MGDVRCGTLPSRFGSGITHQDGSVSKKHPQLPNYKNINVSTMGNSQFRVLSPMKLGPFELIERKVPIIGYESGVHPGFTGLDQTRQRTVVQNFENYWQASKIYNVDVINNTIQPQFFERRGKFLLDPKPHRRTIPKAQGYPVAAYFDGQLYSYVMSRPIYINYYIDLVQRDPKYHELVALVQSGQNVQIIGPDGRDPQSGKAYGENPITYEALEKEMYNPKLPFGHELVLCGLLLDMKPWEQFDYKQAQEADQK